MELNLHSGSLPAAFPGSGEAASSPTGLCWSGRGMSNRALNIRWVSSVTPAGCAADGEHLFILLLRPRQCSDPSQLHAPLCLRLQSVLGPVWAAHACSWPSGASAALAPGGMAACLI